MAILTRAELEARFGVSEIAQLADRDTPAGEDSGAVAAAIADAEAEVIGYVRMVTVSAIPDPAPDLLKRLTATIARYCLWRRDVPEDHPAYIAYRDAVRQLRDIAAGKLALALPGTQDNAATGGGAQAWAPDRHFTDSALSPMLP